MPLGDDLDFQTRYRILRSTSSNSRFRTHAALEQRTGRAVMVHMVDAADAETIDRIREQVGLLPPAEARHVLELATIPSGFAVVTEFIQGLTFFSEWLDEKSAAGALLGIDKSRAAQKAETANQSPELAPTVVIRAPVVPPSAAASPAAPPPVAAPPVAPTPAAPTPVAPSPVAEMKVESDAASSSAPTVVRPAVKASVPPVAPPVPAPVSSPETPAPHKSEPGEFTRIFKMGGTPATGSPAIDQPSSSAPTNRFSEPSTLASGASGAAATPPQRSPDPTPAPTPAAQIPDAKPGEYTQIFGARSAPQPSRSPQQSSLSPLGDVGSNAPTPPPNERTSGGGATGTFGVWGEPSPSASPDFGFGRSDAHSASALPPSSFPPISPAPIPPSIPAAPPKPPTPSTPAASSIPPTSFGGGAIPVGGLSPLLQGPAAHLPTPQSPMSGRADDLAQRNTPAVPSLPAIQTPAFGVGLPPLQSLGDSLDSPFAKPSAPKPGGGYTQINKSVTPAPPPAVAPAPKVVATKGDGYRPPTALVIVIAVVVILAITLILYFALRAPVHPAVAPATNGAASSASSPQQTTPATTPVATPPKNP